MEYFLEKELNDRTSKQLVEDQAQDDGLWFKAEHITEQYLQSALRLLSYAVEKEAKGGNKS